MNIDPTKEVIEVPGSKLRPFVLAIGSSAIVAIGLSMVREGHSSGWYTVAFFGLGVLVAVLQLIPGANRMTIDPSGVVARVMFRSITLRWSEVDSFYVAKIRSKYSASSLIGINYSKSYRGLMSGRRFAKGLTGIEAALPSAFAMSPERLCELLNDCKKRWDSGVTNKSQESGRER